MNWSRIGIVSVLVASTVAGFAIWRLDRSRTRLIDLEPIDAYLRLIETVKSESIFECAENLSAFDDTCWTYGDLMLDIAMSHQSLAFQSEYVPSLVRVRRLIEELKSGRDGVTECKQALLRQLAEANEGFGEAKRQLKAEIIRSDGGVIRQTPPQYWSKLIEGTASVYVLAELAAAEALPELAKIIRDDAISPINRDFLHYCSTRILSQEQEFWSDSDLDSEISEYLAIVADVMPGDTRLVAPWDYIYSERDLRYDAYKREPPGRARSVELEYPMTPSIPGTQLTTSQRARCDELLLSIVDKRSLL